jgi:hypothetical protein
MVKQFLKIAGVRSEKEFYNKYPTKQAFFNAHPDAEMLDMAMYGGAYQMGGGMQQQAAAQGGGDQQEQIIQFVAQALQQGADPQEIMQQLVEAGIPQEQAGQLIQAVAEQLQQMTAQPQQGQQPMMRMGGAPCYNCGGRMMADGGDYSGTYSAGTGAYYRGGGAYVPTYAQAAYGGGMYENGGAFDNPGFRALPPQVQSKIMGASKKMVGGDLKVGGEYNMTQAEVDDLIRKGYKVKYVK